MQRYFNTQKQALRHFTQGKTISVCILVSHIRNVFTICCHSSHSFHVSYMLLYTDQVSYSKYVMIEFPYYMRTQEIYTYQEKSKTLPNPSPHLIWTEMYVAKKHTLKIQFSLFFCNCFFVPIVPTGIKSVGVAAESKFHVRSSFSCTDAWAVGRIVMLLWSYGNENRDWFERNVLCGTQKRS